MDIQRASTARNAGWRYTACICVFFLLVLPAMGQNGTKDDSKSQNANAKDATTSLLITVTGGPKNQPVDNASVYLRWEEPRTWRHAKEMEFDLKTSTAGIAKVKDVPRRRIIIQVIKDGWKPFGQYFDLTQDEQKIEIKLEKPPRWY